MCLLEWIRFNASLDDTVKSWTNKATSHTWFPTVRLTAKCTATTKMAFSTGTVHCPSTRTRTGQPTCTACSSSRLHSTHKACLPSHRAFPAARPETNSDRCARALISTDLAARLRERLRYGGIVGPCSYWPLPLPLPPQATPFSLFFLLLALHACVFAQRTPHWLLLDKYFFSHNWILCCHSTRATVLCFNSKRPNKMAEPHQRVKQTGCFRGSESVVDTYARARSE